MEPASWLIPLALGTGTSLLNAYLGQPSMTKPQQQKPDFIGMARQQMGQGAPPPLPSLGANIPSFEPPGGMQQVNPALKTALDRLRQRWARAPLGGLGGMAGMAPQGPPGPQMG